MKLLYFKNWLVESYFLEMATLNFGGHRGKDHTQTPTHYLQWMRDQVASGQGNFNLTDQGRKLTNKEILANIDAELAKRKGGATPTPTTPTMPTPTPAAAAKITNQGWIWAKSIAARPDYDLPAVNLDLAMKQQDANNWMFVILDPEEGRLVSRGLIPTADLRNVVKSEKKDGQPVKANKPSELLQLITPKKQNKGNTIPDDRLTQEQKAIEERFTQMLASPKQSHMMINALAGSGKAQPLDSLLLTPKGWIEMGNIKVGDLVYGSDGMPHVVKGVFPQGMKEIFEVKFTDNTSVECCEEHLWTTENRKNRWKCMRDGKPIFSLKETNSTKKLAEDLICKDRLKHYIPLVEPINFLKKKVKIDPYVMGVLLGDGCFRSGNLSYSTQDQEIIKSVDDYLIKETNLISKHKGKGYDYRITGNKKGIKNPLILEIKRLNLWDKSSRNKFIPDDYKFNDVSTRIAVLQGLLDTDGHVKPNTANIEYSTVSEQLCDDVKFLVESLGGTVTIKTRIPTFFYKGIKKNGQLCYRMTIKLNNNFIPFRLSRKIKNYKPREKYFPKRAIASIQSLGIQKECQCISIDSEDNLYVTNNCILTHNTTVLKHLAWKFSQGKKWLYLVFNAKNKEEAKEEFPPNVQVETTNGWAGREVLGKNHLQPTDRIQDYSSSDKARLVADSNAFKQLMKSLRIPDQEEEYGPDPKQLSGTERGLWYILRSINSEFKSEAVRLLGLAKSYAIDPRDTKKLQDNLRAVMDKYDLNTDLDDIKERLQKNSPWAEPYISQLMNQNFLSRSFENELAQATTWLLQQVMPHASQETFTADAGRFRGTEQNLGTKRDFDDDLWFSAIHADELNWPKYDVVLADEVQDFNVAQKIILKKLAEKGAKIVAVGDPNQSIYRFRGSDSEAFYGLRDMLKSMSHDKNVEHGLTANFRSRQAIIDMANDEGAASGHVSNLIKGKPFKETPGKIGKGQATKYDVTYEQAFDTLKKEISDMGEIKQTAFLARTNEPLVHASLKLMKDNVPFVILGKDIANDLNKHVDKIINLFRLSNNSSVMELEANLASYRDEQVDQHSGKAAMAAKLKQLSETTDAMLSAIEQFREEKESGSVYDFRMWMRSKFGGLDIEKSGREGDLARAEYKKKLEEQNPVILSTVHKSKGLQFQRVYILRDDLWPHPSATRDADLSQEMNNRYIGRTRAEDELNILKLKGQPGYRDPSEKKM
jgi:superfamily I DNA/RNA helicase